MEPSPHPVLIVWDFENCAPPRELEVRVAVQRIRATMWRPPAKLSMVVVCNVDLLSPQQREQLQDAAISLLDAKTVKQAKNVSDNMMIVEMYCFALDNPPPASILLISGDGDFLRPLARLHSRGYNVTMCMRQEHMTLRVRGSIEKLLVWEYVLFPERLSEPAPISRKHAVGPVDRLQDALYDIRLAPGAASADEDDDSLSIISDHAVADALTCFCDVLLDLYDAGLAKPLTSRIGVEFTKKYPQFKGKGGTKKVIDQLVRLGLATLEKGTVYPQEFIIYDCQRLSEFRASRDDPVAS
eukprot:TRINITY_DN14055_c0_g1_i1.p1 TRINITY_DN14055_c0_g1~~TRINITY_DN14055_c0_g1_i1.p1  ORF type:complete len:312 (-),score=45.50 TRINITY_DN14055_c0_g1_i1:20-913(-)